MITKLPVNLKKCNLRKGISIQGSAGYRKQTLYWFSFLNQERASKDDIKAACSAGEKRHENIWTEKGGNLFR